MWQLCRSEATATLPGRLCSLAVSADGTWLAGAREDVREVTVWNLRTREAIPLRLGKIGLPLLVAFSPTAPLLAIVWEMPPEKGQGPVMRNDRVILWDAGRRQLVREWRLPESCNEVFFSADGKLLLTADNGLSGASDGNVDTVTVVDLEAVPPRVIDKVVVGDGPEGFAISPDGRMAVAVILRGSNADKKAFFYNRNGSVVALKIDGKKVTRTNEIEVRGLPEGLVFSDDGKYLYVGNYLDSDVTILQVVGDQLVDTGKRMSLPGHPAAMRGRAR